jgi:hypothetical protein
VPLKEGIVELRQKGASLRLIRELLATVDVAVGTDTIIETISPPTCGRSGFHCCDAHSLSDTAASIFKVDSRGRELQPVSAESRTR